MNMSVRIRLCILALAFAGDLSAQRDEGFLKDLFAKKTEVRIAKYGPYIGLQRGAYTVLELGAEYQWKRLKLIKPVTNAVHMGFNYNFRYNVLGYDVGYWFKRGRLNLTYGINLNYRTDFTYDRFGFSPVLGYKLFQFHLQTGYHFLTRSGDFTQTNSFFISLHWVLIQDRDLNIRRKKR